MKGLPSGIIGRMVERTASYVITRNRKEFWMYPILGPKKTGAGRPFHDLAKARREALRSAGLPV